MNKKLAGLIIIGMVAALTGCTVKTAQEPASTETPSQTVTEPVTEDTQPSTESEPETSSIEETTSPEGTTEPDETPEEQEPGKKLIIASDIHYFARELTDMGLGFNYMVEHGDGKVVNYIWEITDAFIEEVIDQKPEALILSGDLSLNGEYQSHVELADKLERIEKAGIPVLVIPGNHDINNVSAAAYEGGVRFPAEQTTPQEFESIYSDFGYDEAISRDEYSLSYVYQLDEYNRLLMLDSCQYEDHALVGGMIKSETYDWIELEMEDAWEQGMNVIPVAHHNLLDQSRVYIDDCTIEHSSQLIDQLEAWDVGIFLSGHLHVQHYRYSNEQKDGICEIVTSSLATPPCQYGILEYTDDAVYTYNTKVLDVEAWALDEKVIDDNLLEFNTYKGPFLMRVFYNKAYEELKHIDNKEHEFTDDEMASMSQMYAKLNSYSYAGLAYKLKEETLKDPSYKLWTNYTYPSILMQYMEEILTDAVVDYNHVKIE